MMRMEPILVAIFTKENENLNKISLARNFAKKKHECQTRRDGKTLYFKHLDDVARLLKKIGVKDQDILCAGWLHDTIEDTSTDYDDIYEKFGKKVADIVASVTKDTMLQEERREKKYIQQLRHSTWQAKIVKLCDIIANIIDLENSGYNKEKKIKQVKKKLVYFNAIKSGIVDNKSKTPKVGSILSEINENLKKYGNISIII
jgi:guanosine-3',5'-bis(diphosphate) 3'-pyrophosphohydrolase